MTHSSTQASVGPAKAVWTFGPTGDVHDVQAENDIAAALADPSLAALHKIHAPVVVAEVATARLLFASASACALFGTRDPLVLHSRIFGGNDPASRRLAALAANIQPGVQPKLERLRFFIGTSAETLTVLCRTLAAPSGAVLFVFAAMGVRAALLRPLPALSADTPAAASPAIAEAVLPQAQAEPAPAAAQAGSAAHAAIASVADARGDAGQEGPPVPEKLLAPAHPEPAPIHDDIVRHKAVQEELPAPPLPAHAAAQPRAPAAPDASMAWPERPVRFAWRSDAHDIVTEIGENFTGALHLQSGEIIGQSWQALAIRVGFDPDAKIQAALQRRASFSGLTVLWPLAQGSGHVPIGLGGAPVCDADRQFNGHRGYGIIRFDQRVPARDAETAAPEAETATLAMVAPDASPAPGHLTDHSGVSVLPSPAVAAEDRVLGREAHSPLAGGHLPEQAHRAMHGESDAPLHRAIMAELAAAAAKAVVQVPPQQAGAHHAPLSDANAPAHPHAVQDPEPEPQSESASERDILAAPVEALVADQARQTAWPTAPEVPSRSPDLRLDDIASDAEVAGKAPVEVIPATKIDAGATSDHGVATPAQLPGRLTPPDYHEHRHVMQQVPVPGHAAPHHEQEPSQHGPPAADAADDSTQAGSKVIRLRPLMVVVPPSSEPIAAHALQAPFRQDLSPHVLSTAEHHAFREIARKLGAQDADVAAVASPPQPAGLASLSGDVSVAIAPPPPPVAETDAAALLQRLPVGVLVSRDGQPLFVNRCLLDMLGYAEQHGFAVSHGMERMFRGRQPEALDPAPEGGTLPVVALNGDIIMVDARLQSIDWGGAPATLMSFRRAPDTEPQQRQHTMELELRQSEAKVLELRAILDTATDGVVVLDDKRRILSLNAAAEALFGYGQNEIAGESVTMLIARESQAIASDYLDGIAGHGGTTTPGDGREIIGRARQGGAIPLFMTLGRVGDGPDPKFCAVLRDLTRWKKAERDLSDARQQAEHASALKTDFLAKISHEIRTPLNAILGFAEVMIEERFGTIGNDRYKEYLGDIHASGKHVMSLVNDLLDLSKIEAGKMDLEFASVDANKIIAECVAMMQPEASRERVVMRQSLAARLPNVVADERALRQIVINLLSNAVKFNESGGQVIVSTTLTDAGHAVIRIRDTGIGMSEADLLTALEPFKQLKTSRKHSGTGLGLPLTKALVEANRAVFTIKSKKGEGTLVEVAFPPTRVLAE